MTDISYSTGDPWSVTISRIGDGHVIHLRIGNVKVILPALEAHKLGSALHAASGLGDAPPDAYGRTMSDAADAGVTYGGTFKQADGAINSPLGGTSALGASAKDGSNDPQCYDDLAGSPTMGGTDG